MRFKRTHSRLKPIFTFLNFRLVKQIAFNTILYCSADLKKGAGQSRLGIVSTCSSYQPSRLLPEAAQVFTKRVCVVLGGLGRYTLQVAASCFITSIWTAP
jgi:hypothetical protein